MIGKKVIFLNETESTNKAAYDLIIKEKLPEGTVITAGYQSSGKGRGANSWESAKNKNLLLSVVLYPEFLEITQQFFLSKTIALGISDFLDQFIPDVAIKWPNDIYVSNKKICGTLIEQAISGKKIQHSIIGIGININQVRFHKNTILPTSLKKITGIDYDLSACLNLLCICLNNRCNQLKAKKFVEIDKAYDARLYRKEEGAFYKSGKKVFEAIVKGVGTDGCLILKTKDGIETKYAIDQLEFIL